ncbi:MAG TPA: glycosyltransferase family 39 protein [Thermoanaerobaculia bacterium]|nr:glycosyltransferase family 39 protein [Thermoanaerobaculia bacterium]
MSRAAAIAVVIVFATVLLSPLRRELYVGDETKYSRVVREMRLGSPAGESPQSSLDRFLLPTLEGSPFTHKPPLHFWLMGALTFVFGLQSLWSYVLPSIVAFALLLLLMHRIGGPFAAFVTGTSLLLWGSAQTARMDVAFAGLLALAAWWLHRQRLVAAGFAAGVAFLVKGPMAPVILIALYLFESIRKKRRPRGRDALMLVPMLVLPLVWLVPAIAIGGEAYWREIFFKQTVGRAVGAWVHQSPPWFYLVRAPLTLMPWFFVTIAAAVAAYKRNDERAKLAVSWLLAVLVPYTLLSSKLDVYMMTLLPAVGLLVARLVDAAEDRWSLLARRLNLAMLALFALIGLAGLLVQPSQIKGEDGALVARADVRALFAILLVAALLAIVVSLRGRLASAVLATGFVAVAALSYAAVALVPLANELASTRPLVRALAAIDVPPEEIALHVTPHLWTREMNPALGRARHVDANALQTLQPRPRVIVTRRKDAAKIAPVLQGYRRVAELRMIGKWFDVYER